MKKIFVKLLNLKIENEFFCFSLENISNIILYFNFPLFSDQNGPQEFVAASEAVIKSPKIPAQVKPIFQGFIQALAATKPCIANADLKCIRDAFENVGVKGMQKGVSLTSGQLQELFQRMLNLDKYGVTKMDALPATGGHEAVDIGEHILHIKAGWINQYLAQP